MEMLSTRLAGNRTCMPRAADGFGADRYFDAKASLLISEGDYATAIQVLTSHCFASYLGERPSLVNKWCKFTLILYLDTPNGLRLGWPGPSFHRLRHCTVNISFS